MRNAVCIPIRRHRVSLASGTPDTQVRLHQRGGRSAPGIHVYNTEQIYVASAVLQHSLLGLLCTVINQRTELLVAPLSYIRTVDIYQSRLHG